MWITDHIRLVFALTIWISGAAASYSCDPSVCVPPTCFCPSTAAPGSLALKDTPQIMVLTIGDAVTEKLFTTIDPLLKRHSLAYAPGCPVPATFLSSVAWADFYSLSRLYAAGHEIGSRGFGSFNWGSGSKEVDATELAAARDALVGWTGIPKSSIEGFRSPGYVLSSETFKALAGDGTLKYDTSVRDRPGSVTTKQDGEWSWPYTLNNGLPLFYGCSGCKDGDSFGSVWELPSPLLLDSDGNPIPGGLDGLTGDDAFRALKGSFDTRYENGNRSPYVLNVQPGWLYTPGNVDALDAFLKYVNGKPDTFFLTAQALVRWMQDPVPSSAMSIWEKVKCPSTPRPLDSSRVTGKCTGSSDDAIRECVYTKNPESTSDVAFYYRTLTCLPSCPVQPPTVAVPVPSSPPPETACNPPNGGCLYGNWDSSACQCQCLGEALQSQNGFCRDPTGRCTVLKNWNAEKNWYEPCGDTVVPPDPGNCQPPSGACFYGTYDYTKCSCKCTNEDDQAQIGWCKDAYGRCSVLKTWDSTERRYNVCKYVA